jgi:hypothetical protein
MSNWQARDVSSSEFLHVLLDALEGNTQSVPAHMLAIPDLEKTFMNVLVGHLQAAHSSSTPKLALTPPVSSPSPSPVLVLAPAHLPPPAHSSRAEIFARARATAHAEVSSPSWEHKLRDAWDALSSGAHAF